MKLHNERGEFDRLKDELRRMKRTGAPWYFESELHRRLHSSRQRHGRLSAFPGSTAFAITLVAVAGLAGASYLLMLQAGLFTPNSPAPPDSVGRASPPAQQKVGQPSPAVVGQASPPVQKLMGRASQVAPASPPVERQADSMGQASPPVPKKLTLKDSTHTPTDTASVAQDTLHPPKSP